MGICANPDNAGFRQAMVTTVRGDALPQKSTVSTSWDPEFSQKSHQNPFVAIVPAKPFLYRRGLPFPIDSDSPYADVVFRLQNHLGSGYYSGRFARRLQIEFPVAYVIQIRGVVAGFLSFGE